MDLFEVGITGFFSKIMREAAHWLDRWYKEKSGEKLPCVKVDDFDALTNTIRNEQIVNGQDVKVHSVCISNFAPLYLCYEETFQQIRKEMAEQARRAKKVYENLKERHDLTNSTSLFLEAARGKVEIDSAFHEYIDSKKLRFLGMSLARFGPITENLCYGALFKAGGILRNHTAPLANDVNLEPFVPIFSDPSFSTIQLHSYVDADVSGRAMILPESWADILRQRGVAVYGRPFCIYVPRADPYYIKSVALETWMSLDAWVNFKTQSLNLPFFQRFEPSDDASRKAVCENFKNIYDELNSISKTDISFYSDYVQPFIKDIKPILNMETLRRLVSG